MSRFETQLQRVDPGFAQVLQEVPLLDNPPLAPDWLRCEMLERYQVLQHAPVDIGSTVLEVGSGGHGIATVPLAFRTGETGRVLALERERWGMFREIVTNAGYRDRVRPVKGDARQLPLAPTTVDLALCVHGIRSLRSEKIMVEVFREMLRVAPKIFLAESLPVAVSDAQRAHLEMYDLRQEFFEATTGERDDLHYLAAERLGQLVAEAGGVVLASQVVEVDLPHALAYFPRDLLKSVKDPKSREELLARWDRAEQLRRVHGTDHPPVGVIVAARS